MNKKKILKILILLLWMGVIFIFSHQPNSGEVTHSIIEELIFYVKNELLIDGINFIVRKSAHIIEYFILTLLFVSLMKEYTKNDKKIIVLSLIFCFLYAITDEYHQSLVIGRTSSFKDVLIDTIGGILFIITYMLYKKNSMK